jgi:hypothetical protein
MGSLCWSVPGMMSWHWGQGARCPAKEVEDLPVEPEVGATLQCKHVVSGELLGQHAASTRIQQGLWHDLTCTRGSRWIGSNDGGQQG